MWFGIKHRGLNEAISVPMAFESNGIKIKLFRIQRPDCRNVGLLAWQSNSLVRNNSNKPARQFGFKPGAHLWAHNNNKASSIAEAENHAKLPLLSQLCNQLCINRSQSTALPTNYLYRPLFPIFPTQHLPWVSTVCFQTATSDIVGVKHNSIPPPSWENPSKRRSSQESLDIRGF